MDRIKAKKAALLSVDDTRRLVNFCNNQRESLWDSLDLQGILDVYHASEIWDGVEAWLQEEPKAVKEYARIHKRSHQRAWQATREQERIDKLRAAAKYVKISS